MFGKPAWFQKRKHGFWLRPATWQGYAFVLVWAAVIILPSLFLATALERLPEAGLWLAASLFAFLADVRSVKKQIRSEIRREEEANLLYIGDDEADEVQTQNYKLQLRG